MNIFLGETCQHDVSSIIAVIPARAGSKGLPGKNFMPLGRLPLVEHSIRLALAVRLIDTVVVTTDSPDILLLRHKYPSVIFLERPARLAQDASTLTDVITHVFSTIDLNLGSNPSFLILQPTTPFRLPKNITNALLFAQQFRASSMISVVPMSQHPSECIQLKEYDWCLVSRPSSGSTRRQDYVGDYYFISGSFYFSTLERFQSLKCDCFKSGSSLWNSNEPIAIDIDSSIDFSLATHLFDFITLLFSLLSVISSLVFSIFSFFLPLANSRSDHS
jgi:CMP-N-acetylneuraminic acid synthetase